jgi:hypothetical protein
VNIDLHITFFAWKASRREPYLYDNYAPQRSTKRPREGVYLGWNNKVVLVKSKKNPFLDNTVQD